MASFVIYVFPHTHSQLSPSTVLKAEVSLLLSQRGNRGSEKLRGFGQLLQRGRKPMLGKTRVRGESVEEPRPLEQGRGGRLPQHF